VSEHVGAHGGDPVFLRNQSPGAQVCIRGTRFDNGDFCVAVQWHDRVPGNEEHPAFRMREPAVYVVNSTELRQVLAAADVTSLATRRSRDGKWLLVRTAKAETGSWCR
jgi:hypothetical protein